MKSEPAAADAAANVTLIESFYAALARRDAEAMLGCYGPDVRFSDPVFPDLDARGVAAMWRMLCERGRDLAVTVSDVRANRSTGSAHWVATYTYSATGRPVENRIDASFVFQDGRIALHRDRFDLYRWARQALGLVGLLLGWSPPLQRAIRARAAAALAVWQAKHEPAATARS